MIIKNCKLNTTTRYPEDEDRYASGIEVLEIEIPLPGGKAQYTIDLPKGMKENLEFAAQLSEKV